MSPEAEIAAMVHALCGSGPPETSLADPALRESARAVLGPGPLDWAAEVARTGVAIISERNVDDPLLPVEDVGRAAETALLEMLLDLAGSPLPQRGTATPHHRIIRDSVVRDVSTDRVLAAVRHLQQHWTDLLLDRAAEIGAGPRTLRGVVVAFGRGFDRFLDVQMKDYLAERERYLGSIEAQRGRILTSLVDGKFVDPGLVRDRLAVDLDDHHVAVVSTTLDDTATGLHALRRAVDAIARALDAGGSGTRSVLRHEIGDGTLWMWVGGPRAPRLDRVAGVTSGDDRLRIGVGSPHRGAQGFRRTHHEALDARRIAEHGARGSVVLHKDVALAALLSPDVERARWFVGTWLGPLAAHDPATAELRDTLHHHHRSNMRPVTTAAAMHLHRNTLVHRLHRIEALLGHPVTENVPEVRCALLLADEFGADVLGGARY